MYYDALFRRLNRYKVKYVVCGGLAVNLLGAPRYTKDTDLLIDWGAGNRARLWDALTSLGYVPVRPVTRAQFVSRGAVRWLKEDKHAVVFSFGVPGYSFLAVDVLLDTPVEYRQAARSALTVREGSLAIPIVSIPDLIRMKKKAKREQDISDIRVLRRLFRRESKNRKIKRPAQP